MLDNHSFSVCERETFNVIWLQQNCYLEWLK